MPAFIVTLATMLIYRSLAQYFCQHIDKALIGGGKGRCLGIIFGAMSYTVIDKIIVALKMDPLINDAIKGVILIIVILIQFAGPQIKGMLQKKQ